ncbi:MAG TPA: hypothetical protein VFE31_14165 [Opitutaceae bacterium]|nr:hypothetical protein [Opitutaceae bacterium]
MRGKVNRQMFAVGAALLALGTARAQVSNPISVRLVLITDAGPTAEGGETLFDRWEAADHMNQAVGVPGLESALRSDGQGTLLVAVGAGANAAAQLVALGLDPRFDFSHAYWLAAGTAAANPDQASLGSAAWAQSIINGDEAYEVDRGDAPSDWPYGIVPLGGSAPKAYPLQGRTGGEQLVYRLNLALARGAYMLSRDAALPDRPELRKERGAFVGYDNAARPPFVLLGAVVGSSRYWHGKVLTQWASDWAQHFGGMNCRFAMADTSDQAIAAALATLARARRADFRRLMVLRAAAVFTVDSSGRSKEASQKADYGGFKWAAEAAFLATQPVIQDLQNHWDSYFESAP